MDSEVFSWVFKQDEVINIDCTRIEAGTRRFWVDPVTDTVSLGQKEKR